jgi:4-amino-4-deoxy-L-arabinose transferase-like glycosyltransferase
MNAKCRAHHGVGDRRHTSGRPAEKTLPPSMLQQLDDRPAMLRAATCIILAGALVRLGLAALLDPGVDEAYAMAVAAQWQLSWFDHPPMAFWWVKAMRELARPFWGDDVPVVILRLPFVLAFTATSVVMFDLTHHRWGPRAGLWMLLALSLAPFFLVSAGSWMVPDGPLFLFLALTARLLDRILFTACEPARRRRLWYAAGLTLGLAGLSKYHAVLFALGAAAFILATHHRSQLKNSAPWVAVAIAAATVSPILVWNAQHHWVSLLFQSSRGLGSSGPDWTGFARAMLGQLAYLGPWTLIASIAALSWSLRTTDSRTGPAAFLAAIGMPPIVLFTAVPLWGGSALPHWQMPGWLFLLPMLGFAIAVLDSRRYKLVRLAKAFAVTALAGLAFAIVAVTVIRVAPPSSTLVARLGLGGFLQESITWRGLADGLSERRLLPATSHMGVPQDRPLVVAFEWIDASRVAEVLGPRATVIVFDNDPRGFAFLADSAAWLGRDVLFVGRSGRFAGGLELAQPYFTRIDRQAPIPITLGNETLFQVEAALGRSLISPFSLPYPRP